MPLNINHIKAINKEIPLIFDAINKRADTDIAKIIEILKSLNDPEGFLAIIRGANCIDYKKILASLYSLYSGKYVWITDSGATVEEEMQIEIVDGVIQRTPFNLHSLGSGFTKEDLQEYMEIAVEVLLTKIARIVSLAPTDKLDDLEVLAPDIAAEVIIFKLARIISFTFTRQPANTMVTAPKIDTTQNNIIQAGVEYIFDKVANIVKASGLGMIDLAFHPMSNFNKIIGAITNLLGSGLNMIGNACKRLFKFGVRIATSINTSYAFAKGVEVPHLKNPSHQQLGSTPSNIVMDTTVKKTVLLHYTTAAGTNGLATDETAQEKPETLYVKKLAIAATVRLACRRDFREWTSDKRANQPSI